MKSMRIVCAALMALALLSCVPGIGPATGNKAAVTIRLVDKVLSGKSVLPVGGAASLTADHYTVHGAGTGGVANGATFDQDVSSAGTMTVNLLLGTWTISATAYNAAGTAIGGASTSVEITSSTGDTISLPCVPYDGTGTLTGAFSWVPDVLLNPSAEAELVDFAGTSAMMPITLDSSTSVHGQMDLAQGWYTGFLRLKDAGNLSAGIVRSVRVAANMTTAWSEYLTVQQLQGGVTLDASWYGGLPLNLTVTPAQGAVTIYDGGSATFAITGSDKDAGTSLIYAWYVNGQVAAVGTSASYTAQASDFLENAHAYLSAVVWQSDGKRAADAQWEITREALNPGDVVSGFVADTTGGAVTLVLHNQGGGDDSTVTVSGSSPYTYTLAAAPGTYKLEYHFGMGAKDWWVSNQHGAGGTGNVANATVITLPTVDNKPFLATFGQ